MRTQPTKTANTSDVIMCNATELVEGLRREELSCHDLLDAIEKRISCVDQSVNALPTLCFDRARNHADKIAKLPIEQRGILCGLPVAIKDLSAVSDVRTTYGSTIYSANLPDQSDVIVENLELEGGVVYAKSNTPEFGAGGNTFNNVFGYTRNPWDLSKSAGGSSGGAAAALASGTAWLAQGSDNAGSLRSPASFCGIVGLRPSVGRVARGPNGDLFESLSVLGPMARNVEDVALFLDAMSEPTFLDPYSIAKPEVSFLDCARMRQRPVKIAYSNDLGITPIDPEIVDICQAALEKIATSGIYIENACPEFFDASESYQTLRALSFATKYGSLLNTHEKDMKPEVVENINAGLELSAAEICLAKKIRNTIRQNVTSFFNDYDLLITPATIVPPFPVEQRFVECCNGTQFANYTDWLAIAYVITLASLPALSLPCGFTKSGLPVGLQIIGKPRGEAALLSNSLVFEDILQIETKPILPRGTGDTLASELMERVPAQ